MGRRMAELYVRHAPSAQTLAYLLTGDRAVAEDLAREAFVRVVGRLRYLHDPEAFEGYLRTGVVRACLSRPATVAASTTDGADGEDDGDLWRSFSRLPARERAAVVLRYHEGLSEGQSAAASGCSVRAIRADLDRAMQALDAPDEQRVASALERAAGEAGARPIVPPDVVERARRRQARTVIVAGATVVAIAAASFGLARLIGSPGHPNAAGRTVVGAQTSTAVGIRYPRGWTFLPLPDRTLVETGAPALPILQLSNFPVPSRTGILCPAWPAAAPDGGVLLYVRQDVGAGQGQVIPSWESVRGGAPGPGPASAGTASCEGGTHVIWSASGRSFEAWLLSGRGASAADRDRLAAAFRTMTFGPFQPTDPPSDGVSLTWGVLGGRPGAWELSGEVRAGRFCLALATRLGTDRLCRAPAGGPLRDGSFYVVDGSGRAATFPFGVVGSSVTNVQALYPNGRITDVEFVPIPELLGVPASVYVLPIPGGLLGPIQFRYLDESGHVIGTAIAWG